MVPSVLVIGDIMAEVCLVVDDALSVAPDAEVHQYALSCGGSAANFACCGSALGMSVELMSQMGDDSVTPMLSADLSAFDVGMRFVRRHAGPNSVCVIVIGPDGERRFMSHRGPESTEGPHDLKTLDGIDWVHVSGFVFQREVSAQRVWNLIQHARTSGLTISLDPSPMMTPYVKDVNPALLSHVDYLFPNAFEARALTGLQDPEQAAERLLEMGAAFVALTQGADGVLLRGPNIDQQLPAAPQPRVQDSTGAGDAFAAGFVAATRQGADPVDAARTGTLAAAAVIARVGGHSGAVDLQGR
jgi:ribokinase